MTDTLIPQKQGWPWKVPLASAPEPELKWPKISIITPSFNQGDFIEETILSVINQEYPNLEYIIMDGGSTDSSVEIIKKYATNINYWESKKDRGQTHALNKGLEHATGDIIAYLNSDDCYMPGALQKIGKAYIENWTTENNKLVFSGDGAAGTAISEPPRLVVNRGMYLKPMNMVHGYGICSQPATFWTRNNIPFDESLRFVMDFDYWVKLSFAKYKVIEIDHMVAFMREHADAKSTIISDVMWLELAYLPFKHSLYFDDIHDKLWAMQAHRYKFTTYLRYLLTKNRSETSRRSHISTIFYTYKMFPQLLFDINFLKYNIKTVIASRH